MLFNSYYFIFYFLPVVLICYYGFHRLGHHKLALAVISIASFVFYAYDNPHYLTLFAGSILVNWFITRIMDRYDNKRVILAIGIVVNVLVLLYFKYFDFFVQNINDLIGSHLAIKNIMLPLGISYFTFRQIAFLVDTYRGETGDYTFLEYIAFISFFAQLVAGPIVLHNELIPQYRDESRWKAGSERFANGLYCFAIGLSKKVLLADVFGKAVSWAWKDVGSRTSAEMALAMLFYTFQLYFDFSGYCDMAVGIGKLFNLDLPINFNSPYKAVSIEDFWKRWHMTLTRFLTKYIYIPLGGNRKGTARTVINIMIVFLISGLWHGANWTFVFWGFLHGLLLVINRFLRKIWNKVPKIIAWAVTFIAVNMLWVMFCAPSIGEGFAAWKTILGFRGLDVSADMLRIFVNEEVDTVLSFIGPLGEFVSRFPWFYMMIYILIAFGASVLLRNIHEQKFKPTVCKAVVSAVMMVWAVTSLTGISTFLYSNF